MKDTIDVGTLIEKELKHNEIKQEPENYNQPATILAGTIAIDEKYSPEKDFNRLCELIEDKQRHNALTFNEFMKLFPEDKRKQKVLINYIHDYKNGLTANPTVLEFLLLFTSSEEVKKIIYHLLELGSPVTALVLENKECREWVSKHEVLNWSCTGTNKDWSKLLGYLMDMKYPITTIEKIIKEKKDVDHFLVSKVILTNRAFTYFNKDKEYANQLLDFLKKRQLIALSVPALTQNLAIGKEIIEEMGSQCISDYDFSCENMQLVNYILENIKEPVYLIKKLLDSQKNFLDPHRLLLRRFRTILSPLETVINKCVDNTLSLDKTKELIIFLLQRGSSPSSPVLLALKKISDPESRQDLLNTIMLNYVPNSMDFGRIQPGNKSYFPKFIYGLIETLIQFKPPIPWLSQITDFVDTRNWKKEFYEFQDNNILEPALKLYQDKTYTLKLIEFLLKMPVNLIRLNQSLDEIKDKEFYGELSELLLPKLFQLVHSQFQHQEYQTIFKLLCFNHDFEKVVNFIDVLKKTHTDYSPVIYHFIDFYLKQTTGTSDDWVVFFTQLNHHFKLDYRFIDLLQKSYTVSESDLVRKKLSELSGLYEEIYQPLLPVARVINSLPMFNWLNQSSYYFKEVKSHLNQQLGEIPLVVLSIIFNYVRPRNPIETVMDYSQVSKFSVIRLQVLAQDAQNSDCGTFAFINGLLSLAFFSNKNTLDLGLNIKLIGSILRNSPYLLEGEEHPRSLYEKALHLMTDIAREIKQGDNDVSPITMSKAIHSEGFKIFFDQIYAIHRLYPNIVPMIKVKRNYCMSFDFDLSEQLNMLYKFVALSDLYHRGKLICFPFYIFIENHWITLLMLSPEVSDKNQKKEHTFLACDSLSGQNNSLLSTLASPIQQVVTVKENLQDMCKKILEKSYREIKCFTNPEIKPTLSLLREVKRLLHVWLAIMKHDDLDILKESDVIKFRNIVALITSLDKMSEIPVTKHQEIIVELRKFSIFESRFSPGPERERAMGLDHARRLGGSIPCGWL